ncbi:molybdopterin molybdotransferase MoeA [bacterium]|nr:molybdopterin molybdotransferase MoeA [bacterium]MBU3930651.1 molybdopterin molybdotransferase MoeA [bacterium]
MIGFDEARKRILERVKRLGAVSSGVDVALGHILAEDLKSGYDFPPFNKSAMDGYAAHSGDLSKTPVRLKCKGIIKAGDSSKNKIRRGECIKIMTGAPVPTGADCVVMVEDTRSSCGHPCSVCEIEKNRKPVNTGALTGTSAVEILTGVEKGSNICLKGEDVRKGTAALEKGTLIRGPEIAIASGLGRDKIKVFRKPCVAVLNTGDELTEPGGTLKKGEIYNSNRAMLMSLLNGLNVKVEYLGIAADRKGSLEKLVRKGLEKDFLIITGGVSAGDYDFVPGILGKCKVKQIVHGVCMKPGKPVYFGQRGNTYVMGTPGNPVSTFVSFLLFIKPALEKMSGKTPETEFRKGELKSDFSQHPGRKHFYPVKVVEKANGYSVYPVKGYSGSADIYSLAKANAFMVVDANIRSLEKRSIVDILLW